jgi:hypothetical protein
MLIESQEHIYSVDYATGQATEISTITAGFEFEGLALAEPGNPNRVQAPPIPTPTLPFFGLLLLGGLMGIFGLRRLRS